MMDGKLLLVSNTTDLSPEEIVARYKSLADMKAWLSCDLRPLT